MNPALSKKAIDKIETLCQLGCSQVNQILEKAGSGDITDELSEFTPSEIEMIIEELTEIMSVYDEKE